LGYEYTSLASISRIWGVTLANGKSSKNNAVVFVIMVVIALIKKKA
jgi:Tfp pilus tip-associated adhesin PilY1